ncbi:MAG: PhzF family phenazine biosynthesis protein [Pseudomonadota bacterium]|nr:PhzF family phenazine biosynthesis protein [Pseudomonadota bacterium]
MRLKFHTVDVFTTRRFAGNPLAIVEGADDLETPTMQVVAREFNLSETIFVQTPDDPAHTAKVRIFMPTDEIPFAGHPTIGCAIHLAQKLHKGEGDFDTVITLEEVAGLVPVAVRSVGGVVNAQFTAPVIPHVHEGQVPLAEIAADALGLDSVDIGFGDHRPGLFVGGPVFVFIPLASREALAKARPAEPAWSRMTEAAGTVGVYCYTAGGDAPETDFRARMFAPAGGIPEDPATGSASAILAAQLLASGELAEGLNAFDLLQGVEMGRPSQIGLEIDVAAGAIAAVRIAGSSVTVSAGEIEVG